MHDDKQNTNPINKKSDWYFFSEEKYIEKKPKDYDEQRKALLRQMPTIESICEFVKAWYDKYLSNADFAFIYPFFTNAEINQLEGKFLKLIQYNVTVKATLYARYYFELR